MPRQKKIQPVLALGEDAGRFEGGQLGSVQENGRSVIVGAERDLASPRGVRSKTRAVVFQAIAVGVLTWASVSASSLLASDHSLAGAEWIWRFAL